MLQALGLRLEFCAVALDERPLPGEQPGPYVLRLARAKAGAAGRLESSVTLGADTAVALDGAILGKPSSASEAREMLGALNGREHVVLTGVWADGPLGGEGAVVETRVRFFAVSGAQLDWYVETGEPMDKAGAYGLQGLGGIFAEALTGSASNVVGLPLGETLRILERVGLVMPWSPGNENA